jgi:hypothetical protein
MMVQFNETTGRKKSLIRLNQGLLQSTFQNGLRIEQVQANYENMK